MTYKIGYAWSVLFRLFHWAFALSIITLVVTGLYINNPWTNTVLEGSRSFPMATMRYIHFLAGFVFTAAVAVRLYLWLFGNRQEKFWDSAPITPRNIKNLFSTLAYYTYLTDRHDERLGHNALAGTAYLITIVLAAIQFISGFYLLYPESLFWQKWGVTLFKTQQQARFIHHILMWYFIIFAFFHLYIVIWNDIKSPEGLISSIFNGRKFHRSSS